MTPIQVQWVASSVSALVAGMVAVGATVAIEQLGGMLGGVIASSPTTVVPSLLGVTFAGASPTAIFQFSMNVPPPLFLSSCVLLAWKMVNERLPTSWSFSAKLSTLITSVLSFWLVGAVIIVLGLEGALKVRPLVLGFTFLIIHAIFGIAVLIFSPTSAPKGSNKVPPIVLAIRGCCAMTTVFVGSIIARSEPSIGGFVSCFPAIFLTTMISVWVSQGDKVASGATGSMVLGGLSVSIFAVTYGILFPSFGWLSTAILAYLIAVLGWSLPLAFFLKWWNSRMQTSQQPALPSDLITPTPAKNDPPASIHLINQEQHHSYLAQTQEIGQSLSRTTAQEMSVVNPNPPEENENGVKLEL